MRKEIKIEMWRENYIGSNESKTDIHDRMTRQCVVEFHSIPECALFHSSTRNKNWLSTL